MWVGSSKKPKNCRAWQIIFRNIVCANYFLSYFFMSFRNILLSVAASSQIALASDSIDNQINTAAQGVHDIVHHDRDQRGHSHVEISSGLEQNHIVRQGQYMEGDFYFVGLHAVLNNWGVYYHWLEGGDHVSEHTWGVTYSVQSDNTALTAWISASSETSWWAHQVVPHRDDVSHKKSYKNHENDSHESDSQSLFYLGFSAQAEAIINQNNQRKTSLIAWAECDIGWMDATFLWWGVEHTHYFPLDIEFVTRARVVDVLSARWGHLKSWVVGLFDAGLQIPFWESKWSIDLEWQVTTRGEKTSFIGLSRTF